MKNETNVHKHLDNIYTDLSQKEKNLLKNNHITERIIEKNKIGLVKEMNKEEIQNLKKTNPDKYAAYNESGFIDNDEFIISGRLFFPLWQNSKLVHWIAIDPKNTKDKIRCSSENNIISNTKKPDKSYITDNLYDFYWLDILGFNTGYIVKNRNDNFLNDFNEIEDIKLVSDKLSNSKNIAEGLFPKKIAGIVEFSEFKSITSIIDESTSLEKAKKIILNLNENNILDVYIDQVSTGREVKKKIIPLLCSLEGIEQEEYIKKAKSRLSKKGLDFTVKVFKEEIKSFNKNNDQTSEKKEIKDVTTKIFDEVKQEIEFFIDEIEICYGILYINGNEKYYPLDSVDFKNWLRRKSREINDGKIVSDYVLKNVRSQLKSEINIEKSSKQHKLSNRVAEKNGEFWYDLGNENWSAVRINKSGWSIVENTPILFRKKQHINEQVLPEKEGDPWKFIEFVNVEDEHQKTLLMVYLISLFIPEINHAILVLNGGPGTAKTTLMKYIRKLVDPSQIPVMNFPRDERQLIQTFDHHYCSFFDNVSKISKNQSNHLCKAATGVGEQVRKLYTDDEYIIRQYNRCIALNGIDLVPKEEDFLSRSIIIRTKKIDSNNLKRASVLENEFQKAVPNILSGIFSTISRAMFIYENKDFKASTRMGDFLVWGLAIAEALEGISAENLKNAFHQNENYKNKQLLKKDPFASAVKIMLKKKRRWEGSASQLLSTLEPLAKERDLNTNPSKWPSPSWVTRRLKKMRSSLNKNGIKFNHRHRNITLRYEEKSRLKA